MKWTRVVCGVALIGPATTAAAQPVQVNVNAASNLASGFFRTQSSIGWYFTPTSTFFLSAIQTRFNSNRGTNADRNVDVELWTKSPATGGSLLRSGSFQSNSALGQFGGGGFAQILLQSGIQYFIGFRNVQGLGFNFTRDQGAQSFGSHYFSLGPLFTDDLYERGGAGGHQDRADPSLRLIGVQVSTVPEPMTMVLMATGLVAMAGATLLRRRRQSKS